jgi:hypothetical protein
MYALIFVPMLPTCPAHLILLDLIILFLLFPYCSVNTINDGINFAIVYLRTPEDDSLKVEAYSVV